MKIFEILENDEVFEVLKTDGSKAPKARRPIKPKKPSNKTIKPISSEPPPTSEKIRIHLRKNDVERAQENLKKERMNQRQNKKQS